MKFLQTYIFAIIIMLFTMNVWGQTLPMAEAPLYLRGNKVYTTQGIALSNNMVKNALANTSAAALWQQGGRQQNAGIGLLAGAGILSAGGIICWGAGGVGGLDNVSAWTGIGLFLAALPVYAVGSIFYIKGKRTKKAAINSYNSTNSIGCTIGISPMGMQLNVKL